MPMLQEMFGREYFVRVLPDRQWETEVLPELEHQAG
jgi:hypothetical protein